MNAIYKAAKCYFPPVKKNCIRVECVTYSQAGRLWHQTWSGQKNLKSSGKVGGYSRYCEIIPEVPCVCWVRPLEKQSCGFILLAHLLQMRKTLSSPEVFGLSFSVLECCVSAYGALKLAVKAGITSCWPGFYLVCAVFLKIRNLHIKTQISNFSWHVGKSGNTGLEFPLGKGWVSPMNPVVCHSP